MREERQALAGLRAIELGNGVAPAFCGKWLAAFGADVLRVETAANDWLRRYSPLGPSTEAETGPLATYLNTGKHLLRLDPESGVEQERLRQALTEADLLVTDLPSERRAELGLSAPNLRRLNPRLVEVGISPFGPAGPYTGFAATPIVLLALGGFQFLSGEPDRPPLALPGFQPDYLSGLFALIGALAALRAPGRGAVVTLSQLEVLASLHQFTLSQYLYQGTIRSRHGSRWENLYPITLLPCADGYLGFAITLPDQWERLCLMMERPDLLADPRFLTSPQRREHADALDTILLEWLGRQRLHKLFRRGQEEWRLPIGPQYDLMQALDDPQYHARGFWMRTEPEGFLQPGLPVKMSATPWQIEPAQPAAGGMLWQPRSQPESDQRNAATSPGARSEACDDLSRPLAGLRVLDFTRVWSGPLCTRILADLGAEVIKIEAPLSPGAHLEPAGPSNFEKLNRNKLRLSLNLRRAEGREIVRRLAARTDVLVENFSARVMPNFGLDYARLAADNPRLIMLAMSGFGSSGPYRDYLAFGPAIEPMTGLCSLFGYPGEGPLTTAIAYPDAVAGLNGAAAVLVALHERDRSGRGQLIDLSQVEATAALLGEYFIAAQISGRQPAGQGNRHSEWAPQGAYPCRGDDQWLSLSVRSDAEWQAFLDTCGLRDRLGGAAFATAAGRRQHADVIDAQIADTTRQQDKFLLMRRLQAAGVPAGAVLNARELLEDAQLRAQCFYVNAQGSNGHVYRMPGTPLTFNGKRRTQWRVATEHGENGAELLSRLLGMDDGTIAGLFADGILAGPDRERGTANAGNED